jgi:hypothetical protein
VTRCPRCPATWTGLSMAHCAACHRTFSTVGNFDRHRPGECLDPATVGLSVVRKHRDTDVWGVPIDEETRSRLKLLRQTDEQGPSRVSVSPDAQKPAQPLP